MREAKNTTLSYPSPKDLSKSSPKVEDVCMDKITFSDDELLLGDIPHNYPLYVASFVHELRINRILGLGSTSF